MKFLLENGANINGQDDTRKTALHRAAYKAKVEAVKVLIENSADVNAKDQMGHTPLYSAHHNSNLSLIFLWKLQSFIFN